MALGPVSWLWERLSGWQQDQVEAAVKAELAGLEGLLALPGGAPRLPADRLADRLAETGGEALVDRPFGWLIGRGLVGRPSCTDRRCDDGTRLDTGGECENCGNVVHIRRARRAKIAAQIDRELPGLSDDERRRVLEERLREQAAIEAEDYVWRREQARAEKARRDEARAADQERAERERAAAAAADAVRQALACEDCGQQRAAGLCEGCGYRRRTEALIVEAGMVAATWSADLADQDAVAAVTVDVRATLEREVAAIHARYLSAMDQADQNEDPTGVAAVLAYGALQTVEEALPEFRHSALNRLGRTRCRDTLHVLMLDGVGFKAVNDTYGHAAGDAVIQTIGQRLARWTANRQALAARLGGDEFAVSVALSLATALAEITALREQLQQPLQHEQHTLRLDVSLGIARAVDLPGESSRRILRGADTAMYQVKKGRETFPYLATRADVYADTVNGRRADRRGTHLLARAA
ncbi:diguanylate cyclase domain-containing protein [Streptomyces atratus]